MPSSLLFRFVVARLRGLVAELELVKNDADQALAAAEVLRATTAGVLDDPGQLELLVSCRDEDPYDERLHAAIVLGGL